jgi:hypothetical protein
MTEAAERLATPPKVTHQPPLGRLEIVTSIDRAPLTPEQARMLPFYHDLRYEIVQPDKVVVATQYFWSKWAPRLGPTLTVLVICLRRHCYYNRVTQERRDWCFPEQATLAREVGVETTKTIRAALQHPLAAYFVRREPRYVYDPARAKKVRTSDISEGRGAENVEPLGCINRPEGKNDRQITPRKATVSGGQKDLQVDRSTGRFARQDSAVNSAPEEVPGRGTNTTTKEGSDRFNSVLAEFGGANAVNPSPAQIARLHSLCDQFDRAARTSQPPATGADWVLSAIREAVESGSHFVAPRRIARICERWAADGGPTTVGLAPQTKALEARPDLHQGEWEDSPMEIEFSSIDSPNHILDAFVAPSFVVFPDLGLHSQPFWQTVCDETRRRLGASPDVALLVGSRLLARDEHVLTIGVPGRSVAERAELRLKKTLQDVTRSIVGRSVEVCFLGYGEWVEAGQ